MNASILLGLPCLQTVYLLYREVGRHVLKSFVFLIITEREDTEWAENVNSRRKQSRVVVQYYHIFPHIINISKILQLNIKEIQNEQDCLQKAYI